MQKKLCTLRPAFWPDLNYFWRIYQCDYVLFTDHLLFIKQTEITVSAPMQDKQQRLRIPVKHTGHSQTIVEKEMDRMHPWRNEHLNGLKTIFTDAPFAYLYLPDIEKLYASEDDNLSNFLFNLLSVQREWLFLRAVFKRSSRMELVDDATEFVIRQCKKFDCYFYLADEQVYENGWVKKEKLAAAGIKPKVFVPIPEAHILKDNKDFAALSFLMQYGPEAGYFFRQFDG